MISKSGEEKSLESILARQGRTNAVRCGGCRNLVAFDDEDIQYIVGPVAILAKAASERGYVKCPWCGKSMYVAERQDSALGKVLTRKYFSVIEDADYEEAKYAAKYGKGLRGMGN